MRSTGGNSTYPKGGVLCSADTFVQAESLVLRIKFCGKSPALRVAANRYRQPYGVSANYELTSIERAAQKQKSKSWTIEFHQLLKTL